MTSWALSDEILYLLRRWHWLAAAALLGALGGWMLAALLPARYEAAAGVSVSFNSDAIYLTPDDYKNWQLAELNDLALSDELLAATLAELSHFSAEYDTWTVADLRAVVEPRWRNAGPWQLVAHAGGPLEAEAIASRWRAVLLQHTAETLVHAAAFDRLDRELEAQAREIGRAEADRASLEAFALEMERWLAAPEAGGGAPASARMAAGLENALQGLPQPLPLAGSSLEEAEGWVKSALPLLQFEIVRLNVVIEGLRADYDALGESWKTELEASRGLSAYLVVEVGAESGVEVSRVYSHGALALAGALLAALLVPLIRLLRVAVGQGRADA